MKVIFTHMGTELEAIYNDDGLLESVKNLNNDDDIEFQELDTIINDCVYIKNINIFIPKYFIKK